VDTGSGLSKAGAAVGVAMASLVAACCAVLVCCVGAWVFLGPVNYFGCGAERPDDISEADLIGTYVTQDGARLALQTGGLLTATALSTDFMGQRRDGPESSAGSCRCTSPSGGVDQR
jgi:hypothetical protein